MVHLSLNISVADAKKLVQENLKNGSAYQKFLEFIKAQQGDINALPESTYHYEVKSTKKGYINDINALTLGELSMQLGAGRMNLTEKLDYGAGITLKKEVGDMVEVGDTIMILHTNKVLDNDFLKTSAFVITRVKPKPLPLIYEVIE